MSELTPCNYCTLRRIEDRAHARGAEVTARPEPFGGEGQPWWIAVRVSDQPEPVAWFLALTAHCVC